MSIFRVILKKPLLTTQAVLESLPDVFKKINDALPKTDDGQEIKNRLFKALDQIKAHATNIEDPKIRGREMFEIVKAEISIGNIPNALNTFEMIGHVKMNYLAQFAEHLYLLGYSDIAIELALKEVVDIESAETIIKVVTSIYPGDRLKFIERIKKVTKLLISDDSHCM